MGALIKAHATPNQIKGPQAKSPNTAALSILPAGVAKYPEGMVKPSEPLMPQQPVELSRSSDDSRLAYLANQQKNRAEVPQFPTETQGMDSGN
jgi:hypothetical protein